MAIKKSIQNQNTVALYSDSEKAVLSPALNLDAISDSASYKRLTAARQTLIDSAAQVVPATTYYVDVTTGDDGNDGSSGSPFKTIQHAIDQFNFKTLLADCKIRVIAGDYTAEGELTVQGINGASLIIVGYTGAADVAAITDSYQIVNFVIRESISISIVGFHASPAADVVAFYFYACSYVTLQYCKSVAASNTYGAVFNISSGGFTRCEFSNKAVVVLVRLCMVFSSNHTAGSGNAVGLDCQGGLIGKTAGTQPQGTTAEAKAYGGIIA